jgi:hypothetical protein
MLYGLKYRVLVLIYLLIREFEIKMGLKNSVWNYELYSYLPEQVPKFQGHGNKW